MAREAVTPAVSARSFSRTWTSSPTARRQEAVSWGISAWRVKASQRPMPRASAKEATRSRLVLPMPRAGTLMTRCRLTESVGLRMRRA